MSAILEDSDRPLSVGGLTIDVDSRIATVNGESVRLSRIEFRLVALMAAEPGRVFSQRQLMEQVWGWQSPDTRTVAVHIARLRKKLAALGDDFIVNVWGEGYRLGERYGQTMIQSHTAPPVEGALAEARSYARGLMRGDRRDDRRGMTTSDALVFARERFRLTIAETSALSTYLDGYAAGLERADLVPADFQAGYRAGWYEDPQLTFPAPTNEGD